MPRLSEGSMMSMMTASRLAVFGRRWRILGQPGHKPTIPLHVAIVLFQRWGEAMSSLSIGHKIEIIRVCWRKGRSQRSLARIPDGPRRHAQVRVGIVRRIHMQVLAGQGPGVLSGLFQRVNDGRVALQRYAP